MKLIIPTDEQKKTICNSIKDFLIKEGISKTDVDIAKIIDAELDLPAQQEQRFLIEDGISWNITPTSCGNDWLRQKLDNLRKQENKKPVWFHKVPETNWRKSSFIKECELRGNNPTKSWNTGSETATDKDKAGVAGTKKAINEQRKDLGKRLRDYGNTPGRKPETKKALFCLFSILERLGVNLTVNKLLRLVPTVFPALGLIGDIGNNTQRDLSRYLAEYKATRETQKKQK